MRDIDLYTHIFGLFVPWEVDTVDLNRAGRQYSGCKQMAKGLLTFNPLCGMNSLNSEVLSESF